MVRVGLEFLSVCDSSCDLSGDSSDDIIDESNVDINDESIGDSSDDIFDNKPIILKKYYTINIAQDFINDKRIKHTCKYCNYSTVYLTAYNKHKSTQKHKNKIIIHNNNNNNNNDNMEKLIKINEDVLKQNQKLIKEIQIYKQLNNKK